MAQRTAVRMEATLPCRASLRWDSHSAAAGREPAVIALSPAGRACPRQVRPILLRQACCITNLGLKHPSIAQYLMKVRHASEHEHGLNCMYW